MNDKQIRNFYMRGKVNLAFEMIQQVRKDFIEIQMSNENIGRLIKAEKLLADVGTDLINSEKGN